jgi:hypothetical protein
MAAKMKSTPNVMVLDPADASRFIEGYKEVMIEIYLMAYGEPDSDRMTATLAKSRAMFMDDRSLLPAALARLEEKGVTIPADVVSAIESLEVKRWIYLKDSKSYSVLLDTEDDRAVAVYGLTQRLKDIVGMSGAIIKTGVIRYCGKFATDGIVTEVVWIGPNYKRDFQQQFKLFREQGRFYVES